MLRCGPCRRSTARLHLPAPRTWPSRCASIRRGWRPIWRGRCRALPGRSRCSQFKGGQSNPTYLLETPSRKYVLRRKPPGKLLPSAHAVDREFRVIAALAAQGFPVAEPVLYCADESVAGTPFYVMGFVEGRVFWNPEMPGSNPRERTSDLRRDERRRIARLHSLRSGGHRPVRLRPRRELRRPPGRPLVEAVPRLADPADRRDGAADRMAAGAYPAGRSGAAGAWRLPARQHDLRHAIRRGCSRCSTGNCPRSAIRSPISAIT